MTTTPPRSHQLAAGSITVGNVLQEVYAAPVGKVVILKAHALHDDGASFDHTYAYIKTGGAEYSYREIPAGVAPATDYMALDLVLEEGDQIGLFIPNGAYASRLRYYFSGSVLSNP